MTPLNIAVIGGSVAGLAAASLLARSGHAVSVFERSAGPLTGRGAGIVTHPGPARCWRSAEARPVRRISA